MEHRQILRASSFGPDAMKVLFTAFDGAWGEIAPRICATPVVVEAARTSLATIVLGLASTELTTTDGLRTMAVAMFCARHRIEVGTDEQEVARARRQPA